MVRRSARLSADSASATSALGHPGPSQTQGGQSAGAPNTSRITTVTLHPGRHRKRSRATGVKVEPAEAAVQVKREVDGSSSAGPSKRRRTKVAIAPQSQLEEAVGEAINTVVEQEMPAITAAIVRNIGAGPSSIAPAPQVVEQKPILPEKGKGKAEKTAEALEEKRMIQFRAKCPKTTMDRVHRVMSQRMFMVDRNKVGGDELMEDFRVLGSTGNVYTVTIGQRPRCDCPDWTKGNAPCKHIIFVFLKVLKVPQTSQVWYQQALLRDELREVFNTAPDASGGSIAVSSKIKNAYLRAIGAGGDIEDELPEPQKEVAPGGRRILSIGEDCPVCYEEMSEQDEQKGRLVYDETMTGCGKPLHTECFNMWAATAAKKGDAVTCVWCRTPWPISEVSGKGKGKAGGGVLVTTNGYLNMADLVGISRERDTSSYYWGPMAGRGRHEARYDDD